YCEFDQRDLPSFPTRRSSDLRSRRAPAPRIGSKNGDRRMSEIASRTPLPRWPAACQRWPLPEQTGLLRNWPAPPPAAPPCNASRSEEHTSELQSREKLVCRLL